MNDKEISAYDKYKVVSKKIEELNFHWLVLAESCCTKNLNKAYDLITKNPDITRKEYLEIMEIEEE